MKISIILIFLIIFALVTVLSDGKREKDLQITSLEIKFDKTDAIFTVNYNFDKFSETFLLLFGTKPIEPKVRSAFQNFEYEIIKMDQNRAILRVKNISVLNKGYYLHNSRMFNDTIGTVYISDPSNTRIREYSNINSTPNYFYR
jgi:hypothetical protein